MVDGGQLKDIVVPDGGLECGGKDVDAVVGWRRGKSVGGRGGRRVRWSVVVVQGFGQVAYVVEWRAAD